MSGPKYYDYPMDNNISTAEFLRAMGKISGVSIKVENGMIKTVVSNAAWEGGINYTTLKELIDKAKHEALSIERDKKKRILQIEKEIESIDTVVEKEKSKIDSKINRLNETIEKADKEFETPFKKYTLSQDVEKLKEEVKVLENEKIKIEQKGEQKKEVLNDFLNKLKSENDSDRYARLIRKQPNITIKNEENYDANAASNEVLQKVKLLSEFTTAITKSVDSLKRLGLDKYIDRLSVLCNEADPLSQDSIKMIDSIMEDIRNEIALLKSQKELKQLEESEMDDANKRIEALMQLSEALKPIFVNASVINQNKIEVEENNSNLIDSIINEIEKVNDLEFITENTKKLLENIKDDAENARYRVTNSSITNGLKEKELLAKSEVEKAIKLNEQYVEYEKETKRYNDLTNCIAPNETVQAITYFETLLNEDADIEGILIILKATNDSIENQINSIRRKGIEKSICASCEDKVVFSQSSEESSRVAYAREETKGVIYDVQIDQKGRTAVYPRGVILSNGKNICTNEQLQKAHSSCDWAKELDDAMTAAGIESANPHEISDEVTKSMYDEKQYIHLNDEQSRLYLIICGYTKEECAELGYEINDNDRPKHQERYNEYERDMYRSKEIK